MKKILFFVALMAFMSCADEGRVLPGPSGRAGEVLIVINDAHWDATSGQMLKDAFTQDVDGLAWSEPLFDISRLPRQAYNDMVRIARNILDVEVGDRYAVAKVKFFKEKFSRTQAYVKVQAPDEASLITLLQENEAKILSFFYSAERERLMTYFAKNKSDEYQAKVKKHISYDLNIPAMFNHNNFNTENFVWLSGGNTEARTDLVMYTYPLEDEAAIDLDFMISVRDSVLGANVPGPSEGAKMRTADVVDPSFNVISINKDKIYEMRGLWETTVDFMGGPFISYAYYDADTKTLKVLEGFIYAPHEDKRNLLRRIEAVAYSWKPSAIITDVPSPVVE